MKIKHKVAALAVGGNLLAVRGVANSSPILIITNAVAGNEEHTGDPGGHVFPSTIGTLPGPGVPWQSRSPLGTITGGWPTGPGMGPDPTFAPNWGTSGWHGAYLQLSNARNVTFEYLGIGDSTLDNIFQVDTDPTAAANWVTLFGAETAPCGASGLAPVFPDCTAGVNEFTFFMPAGFVGFRYITGNGVTLTNDGIGNPDDVTASPGFFLGIDPYLATGNHQTSGFAVYAALTDLPAPTDHDYQDLGVRISIVPTPEPNSLALFGLALAGLAFTRKRNSARGSIAGCRSAPRPQEGQGK